MCYILTPNILLVRVFKMSPYKVRVDISLSECVWKLLSHMYGTTLVRTATEAPAWEQVRTEFDPCNQHINVKSRLCVPGELV